MRSLLVCYCLGILAVTPFSALELIFAHAQAACLITAGLAIAANALWIRRSFALRLCALAAGAALHSSWALNHLDAQLDTRLEGRELLVRGRVATMAKATATALQFEFIVLDSVPLAPLGASQNWEVPGSASGRVLLSYYPQARPRNESQAPRLEDSQFPQVLKPGSELQFTVKLNRPHGFANAGGFDYEAFLFRREITAKGYVRGELALYAEQESLPRPTPWNALLIAAEALRFELRTKILNVNSPALAESADGLAMILALGLGDSSAISNRLWQLFRDTGTVHLFVVSGLHVALFAFLMWLPATLLWHLLVTLAPRFGVRVSRRRWVALWSFSAAMCYALLAGWGLPTRRAVVMLSVVVAGVCLRRRFGATTGLLVALALVLTLCPLAATSSGFWLSFAAVSVLMSTTSHAAGIAGRPSSLRRLIGPQLSIGIGLALPLLILNGGVAWLAPAINLMAIPLLSFVLLPCVLVLLLAVSVNVGAPAMLRIANDLSALLVRLLESVAGLGEAWEPQVALSTLDGLGLALATAILLIPLASNARLLIGGWLSLCLLLSSETAHCTRSPASLRLDLLDVGQGLSALVRTRCHALLFDAGARLGPEFEMGGAVIAPTLRTLGVARLDRVILSHADNDHAGGAMGLMSALTVTELLLGGRREEYEQLSDEARAMTRACRAGQSWRWDGADFEILGPMLRDKQSARNARSCILRVSFAGRSFLLPGDIEANAELALVSRTSASLKADVLIAPHHGSKSSSSYALLKRVLPQLILVPAGYKNSFGHPHEAVLARYEQLDARYATTALGGMLSLEVDAGGGMTGVIEYRLAEPRYWRPRARVL